MPFNFSHLPTEIPQIVLSHILEAYLGSSPLMEYGFDDVTTALMTVSQQILHDLKAFMTRLRAIYDPFARKAELDLSEDSNKYKHTFANKRTFTDKVQSRTSITGYSNLGVTPAGIGWTRP